LKGTDMVIYGVEYEFVTAEPIEALNDKLDVLHDLLTAHAGGVFFSVDIVRESASEFGILIGVPVEELLTEDAEDFAQSVAHSALCNAFPEAGLGELREDENAMTEPKVLAFA